MAPTLADRQHIINGTSASVSLPDANLALRDRVEQAMRLCSMLQGDIQRLQDQVRATIAPGVSNNVRSDAIRGAIRDELANRADYRRVYQYLNDLDIALGTAPNNSVEIQNAYHNIGIVRPAPAPPAGGAPVGVVQVTQADIQRLKAEMENVLLTPAEQLLADALGNHAIDLYAEVTALNPLFQSTQDFYNIAFNNAERIMPARYTPWTPAHQQNMQATILNWSMDPAFSSLFHSYESLKQGIWFHNTTLWERQKDQLFEIASSYLDAALQDDAFITGGFTPVFRNLLTVFTEDGYREVLREKVQSMLHRRGSAVFADMDPAVHDPAYAAYCDILERAAVDPLNVSPSATEVVSWVRSTPQIREYIKLSARRRRAIFHGSRAPLPLQGFFARYDALARREDVQDALAPTLERAILEEVYMGPQGFEKMSVIGPLIQLGRKIVQTTPKQAAAFAGASVTSAALLTGVAVPIGGAMVAAAGAALGTKIGQWIGAKAAGIIDKQRVDRFATSLSQRMRQMLAAETTVAESQGAKIWGALGAVTSTAITKALGIPWLFSNAGPILNGLGTAANTASNIVVGAMTNAAQAIGGAVSDATNALTQSVGASAQAAANAPSTLRDVWWAVTSWFNGR